MSKEQFFAACSVSTEEYSFSDDYKVMLRGLTLRQRKELVDVADDPVMQNAMLLVAGCDELDDGDIDSILDLAGDKLNDMVAIILRLSGIMPEKKHSQESSDSSID